MELDPLSSGSPTEGAPPQHAEYLKWSCGLLWGAFEHETARADRIRDQATAAFVALPVFVGLAMQGEAWKSEDPGIAICRGLTFVCAAAALAAWYLVARVDYHPRISTALFDPGEERGREHDCSPMVGRIRDYLCRAVNDGQKRGSALAKRRRQALLATVVAMLFAGMPMMLKELT